MVGRTPIMRIVECSDGKRMYLLRGKHEVELLFPGRF